MDGARPVYLERLERILPTVGCKKKTSLTYNSSLDRRCMKLKLIT